MIQFSGVKISKIKKEERKDGKLYAEFSIGPVPQGYGYTLANSLRRVLLSSISGYSITSIRINDLTHEFTTIPGVKENVLDIVLRLKKIRFKVDGSEPSYVITASVANKQGEFKAGELEVPAEVKVVNKDYVIATITDKSAVLNLEATLERGVGYKPADDSLRDEIGRIPTDAVFSPVTLVSFEVVPARKGGRADYDKVILKIETDGGVTPEEALVEALKILKEFYTILSETPVLEGEEEEGALKYSGKEAKKEEEESQTNTPRKRRISISKLGLSSTIERKLKAEKINYIEDLIEKTEKDILAIPGLGKKAIDTIKKALKKLDLSLKP